MDSTAKKKPAPRLRLVRGGRDEAPKSGNEKAFEPKSEIGKELTRFADSLDKEIEKILMS